MADLFDQTGIPTGEIGALPLPALSPDELGLPLPLQQALNAPQLPRPTAPQPVLSDPKQKLAALAALGFALGSGPHSGGTGALSGILQAQQQLGQQKQQEFQRQQAEIDKQNQQIEIQQRAAAADLERRRQAFANGVKLLEPQIRAAKTPEQYRSAVTMASSALQAAGFRTPPQWFMANMPYQAPTLQQEASATVDKVMKSDAVKAALQTQGDAALDSISIPLHLQGESSPATPVTLRKAHQLAGIDIGVQQGHVVQTPLGKMNEWQAALDQAANEFQVSFKRAPDQSESKDRLWIEKRAREIAKPEKPKTEATVVVQTVDDQGNPVTRIVPKVAGSEFKKAPGATMEGRLASAKAVAQTGEDIIAQLADPKVAATVGPILGRFSNLREFIGNPPPELSQLAGQIESYALANMGVHGMRSAQGAEQIKKLLDAHHTPQSLIAAIRGLNSFSQHLLENEGGPKGRVTTPVSPSVPDALQSARDKLRTRAAGR